MPQESNYVITPPRSYESFKVTRLPELYAFLEFSEDRSMQVNYAIRQLQPGKESQPQLEKKRVPWKKQKNAIEILE